MTKRSKEALDQKISTELNYLFLPDICGKYIIFKNNNEITKCKREVRLKQMIKQGCAEKK